MHSAVAGVRSAMDWPQRATARWLLPPRRATVCRSGHRRLHRRPPSLVQLVVEGSRTRSHGLRRGLLPFPQGSSFTSRGSAMKYSISRAFGPRHHALQRHQPIKRCGSLCRASWPTSVRLRRRMTTRELLGTLRQSMSLRATDRTAMGQCSSVSPRTSRGLRT